VLIAERRDPAAAFVGTTRTTPWDEFQVAYFDDAGLPRRLDYSVDTLGGGPAVHYPSEYREFDGIMVPTRRRVYVRDPDGSRVLDPVSVAVDVTDVTFS